MVACLSFSRLVALEKLRGSHEADRNCLADKSFSNMNDDDIDNSLKQFVSILQALHPAKTMKIEIHKNERVTVS